jgi:hypothetical protein
MSKSYRIDRSGVADQAMRVREWFLIDAFVSGLDLLAIEAPDANVRFLHTGSNEHIVIRKVETVNSDSLLDQISCY